MEVFAKWRPPRPGDTGFWISPRLVCFVMVGVNADFGSTEETRWRMPGADTVMGATTVQRELVI